MSTANGNYQSDPEQAALIDAVASRVIEHLLARQAIPDVEKLVAQNYCPDLFREELRHAEQGINRYDGERWPIDPYTASETASFLCAVVGCDRAVADAAVTNYYDHPRRRARLSALRQIAMAAGARRQGASR